MILRSAAALCGLLTSLTAADSLAGLEDERASNNSLLWGPYRPNLYFGVRPRIPGSLSLGLLWSRVEDSDYNSPQENFRYTCEQNEGMAGYGWEKYDARTGGVQTIHDRGNEIDITTSFFKDTSPEAGDRGGNWGVRIKGVPREGAKKDLKTTIIVNVNYEGRPGVFASLEVKKPKEEGTDWFVGDVELAGEEPALGGFSLVVKGDEGTQNKHPTHNHASGRSKSLDRTLVNSKVLEQEAVWQTKPILFTLLKQQIEEYVQTYGQENLPPPSQIYTLKPEPGPGNVHFIQKVFAGAFEFDVLFTSAASSNPITSEALTTGISQLSTSFDEKFASRFAPQAPFTGSKYIELGKSLFSNLLGGIGYFHGDWKVDRTDSPAYEEENEGFWAEAAEARAKAGFTMEGPNELFSSIPSRPFFPRGFLWDEGFHLLPVLEWDMALTLQIVRSWFALMDEDGWIGREQILGPEARSKVPDEFQTQYPHYANPPTLFLTLTTLLDHLSSSQEQDSVRQHLKELYPLLQRHYQWFRRTQSGDLTSYDRPNTHAREAYRWRGRTERHCLTSGLDDFPRAQPPHPGELHVDALAWVGLMSKNLQKIASFLGEEAKEDADLYQRHWDAIHANALALHWSDEEGTFCDATIDEFEEHKLVCHKGYVTLLPFMVGLLNPSETSDAAKISKVLHLVGNSEELWTDFGVRSLSAQDPLYGTDENYWRGPIWVNMNYLILTRLYALATSSSSPAAITKEAGKLYKSLRVNLVNTVYESWKETGFAWEQYNAEDGHGQRTQHFTGWTSLVVKILGMPEVAVVGSGAKSGGRDEL